MKSSDEVRKGMAEHGINADVVDSEVTFTLTITECGLLATALDLIKPSMDEVIQPQVDDLMMRLEKVGVDGLTAAILSLPPEARTAILTQFLES